MIADTATSNPVRQVCKQDHVDIDQIFEKPVFSFSGA